MADQEVGRWACGKCGGLIVAAGPRTKSFHGFGAFSGPCPWECGAWINRGFRWIRPGQVKAFRAQEWDQRDLSASGVA
ncbi:MAG TPA: hypothetical protein VFM88_13365 [Vicinamibacteria bacterium]|nr:hypothetical protein [Vicinamibacteria bacterium]